VLVGLLVREPRRRSRRTPWAAAAVVVPVALSTFVGVGTGVSGMPEAFSIAPPGEGGTSVTTLVAPPGPQPVKAFTLTAEPAVIDGTPAYTYDGTVPGPLLRVTQGDRVR